MGDNSTLKENHTSTQSISSSAKEINKSALDFKIINNHLNSVLQKGKNYQQTIIKSKVKYSNSNTPKYKVNSIFINCLAGGLSALITKLVLYPLDTVKVRMQTQSSDRKLFKNSLDCFLKTIKTEGIKGLYMGVLNPIISQILFRANTFVIYGEIKRVFVKLNNKYKSGTNNKPKAENAGDLIRSSQILIAASLSTGICTVFECPFDYFKIQMQVMNVKAQKEHFETQLKPTNILDGNNSNTCNGHNLSSRSMNQQNPNKIYSPVYKNSIDCGRQIYKINGLFGIYRGFRIHFIKNLCGGFYSIGLYEAVRKSYSENKNICIKELPFLVNFLANSVCWLGHFLSFPIDVIKSNIQSDDLKKENRRFNSIKQTVKILFNEGGIRRFYQGVYPSVLKQIPSQSIMNLTRFWIAEHL